jgi:hypothetical protein
MALLDKPVAVKLTVTGIVDGPPLSNSRTLLAA